MAFQQMQSGDGARKTALEALRIMDTPAESRFDRFTRLASRLLQTPLCAVTLLDDYRQWFKSSVGLAFSETSKEDSFCQYALGQPGLMEVPDACLDVRFRDNPYVCGEPYIRFYAGAPISTPDGTPVGTLCVMDTTPRELSPEQRSDLLELARLVESELMVEDLNDTVETQQRRVQEFETRKREAEASNRAKSEFLARMSHEIRTPMNGMLGMLQLLEASPLNAEQQRFLKVARGSGDLLLGLINDILDLSRVEAGKTVFRRHAFDPREVMDQVEALMAPLAREKGLGFALEMPPNLPAALRGDSQRLHQVLLNLVGNAVKYTDDGRVDATVIARHVQSDAIHLDIRIADTGGGIPVSEQERIFEAFAQLDGAPEGAADGTGLGLAIARRLAEGMGGSITLESREGEGSIFTLSLPFQLADRAGRGRGDEGPAAQPSRPEPAAPLKVLLADDDSVSRLVASSLLERDGHVVECVARGDEALAHAMRDPSFDLILLDVEMPGLDGPEVARRVRQHEHDAGLSPVRIAALTAHAMSGDRERFLQAGMDDYLGKPLQGEQLRALLATPFRRDGSAPTPIADENELLLPDEARLLEQVGGDGVLLTELLQTLLDSLQDRHDALNDAWVSSDMEALRREAHSLKGMFANMAMDAAERHARDLEQAVGASEAADVLQRRFHALDRVAATLKPALQQVAANRGRHGAQ